jgi:tRNA-Thr(GGU) m(6)t(6)A37 methyltransferase TsaA
MSGAELRPVSFDPIGLIHSPFKQPSGMPIQPAAALGVKGWIEMQPDFVPGLADLEGFSHLILLYHFHQAGAARLQVTPFLDGEPHGVFATRAPSRPNPIGLSIVRLTAVSGKRLEIENVDILDGTPLLDIKPYIPDFDHWEVSGLGWYRGSRDELRQTRSDDRFGKEDDSQL